MSKRRSKTEDELDDDALMLLVSPEADRFARALDRHGWMIVVKPEVRAEHLAAGAIEPGPCSMKTPGPCPAWAEPHDAWLPERKPVLTLIDGGKDTGSLN